MAARALPSIRASRPKWRYSVEDCGHGAVTILGSPIWARRDVFVTPALHVAEASRQSQRGLELAASLALDHRQRSITAARRIDSTEHAMGLRELARKVPRLAKTVTSVSDCTPMCDAWERPATPRRPCIAAAGFPNVFRWEACAPSSRVGRRVRDASTLSRRFRFA